MSEEQFVRTMQRLGRICLAISGPFLIGSVAFAANSSWCNALSFALVGLMGVLCWFNFWYSIWYFKKYPPAGRRRDEDQPTAPRT